MPYNTQGNYYEDFPQPDGDVIRIHGAPPQREDDGRLWWADTTRGTIPNHQPITATPTALSSCPFCNGKLVTISNRPNGKKRMRCGACGSLGPAAYSDILATELWNVRFYEPKTPEGYRAINPGEAFMEDDLQWVKDVGWKKIPTQYQNMFCGGGGFIRKI